MIVADGRRHVVITGGGVAALEVLLALRALAGAAVTITLITAEPDLAPRVMTVAEPCALGGAPAYVWSQIAAEQDARHILDRLVAVDTATRTAFTHGGRRVRYDDLVLVTGARRVAPFAHALTFGMRGHAAADLRALVAAVLTRDQTTIAFALPSPSTWSLPLYELAIAVAHELRGCGSRATVRIVTPEARALELLGPAASDAVTPTLDALGVELVTRVLPRAFVDDGLLLSDGEVVPTDSVVTLAEIVARPVPGMPFDRAGFVPVDLHGRVTGEPGVYAAGEVTSYPLRQGGVATQQADAAAEAIAAALTGADPRPFEPVLRGQLLIRGVPLALQSEAPAGRSAVALALAIAAAEERCGNRTRALQALEAARALTPGAPDPACARLAARLEGEAVAP